MNKKISLTYLNLTVFLFITVTCSNLTLLTQQETITDKKNNIQENKNYEKAILTLDLKTPIEEHKKYTLVDPINKIIIKNCFVYPLKNNHFDEEQKIYEVHFNLKDQKKIYLTNHYKLYPNTFQYNKKRKGKNYEISY